MVSFIFSWYFKLKYNRHTLNFTIVHSLMLWSFFFYSYWFCSCVHVVWVCICLLISTNTPHLAYGSQRTTRSQLPLLYLMRVRWSKSGHQAWKSTPLPAKVCHLTQRCSLSCVCLCVHRAVCHSHDSGHTHHPKSFLVHIFLTLTCVNYWSVFHSCKLVCALQAVWMNRH